MPDVKWIKITTDMFDNRKIKHLRRLPEGDSIVLIWVMLLTMAGRCNAGGMIFLTENIPYTPKMLADELDFEENTVQLALKALEQFGMVVSDGHSLLISNWQEYQNVEGMEKIREQTRQRVAAYREKQKLLSGSVTGNVTVTQSNATDKEEDKEKEEDQEIYTDVISYLNERAGTNYRATTKKTKSLIHARLVEGFDLEDFKTVIDKKCAEWKDDKNFAQYLRPETLFGTKFEGYLNAKPRKAVNHNGSNHEPAAGEYADGRYGIYL